MVLMARVAISPCGLKRFEVTARSTSNVSNRKYDIQLMFVATRILLDESP